MCLQIPTAVEVECVDNWPRLMVNGLKKWSQGRLFYSFVFRTVSVNIQEAGTLQANHIAIDREIVV